MKKNRLLTILSCAALLALAGCTPLTGVSSSAQPSSSTEASSSAEESSSQTSSSSEETSSALASLRLELSLAKTTMPAGVCFFEGCVPALNYINGATTKDMTQYFNFMNWDIEDSGGTSYTYGQVLSTAGKYTVKVTYISKSITSPTVDFTVEEGVVEDGAEGKGFTTVSTADSEKYAIGQYDNVGALGQGKFPTIGTHKLLVVPVQFANAGMNIFSDNDVSVLNSAYFGDASSTGWQSLASYYDTSSYGKLTLEGTVIAPFTYTMDAYTFEKSGDPNAVGIANAAIVYAKGLGYNMADYDSNGDGFVDGLELIYKTSRPDKGNGGADVWWDFTTITSNTPNVNDPVAYRYFWSLYKSITDSYYTPNIDCHTLIHESGHMMGLNDYYSYNSDEGPAGCVDMMDMNVGDHDAYSKFMYGWVAPKVIDGSSSNFTLTLNSFTDTGDCALLRNTVTDPWNGTPYDEYLMLQYYTPTGLNAKDSTGYPEWSQATSSAGSGSPYGHAGTYEKAGLQVFHVDNRLAAAMGAYTGTATSPTIATKKYAYVDTPSNVDTFNDDGTYVSASSQIASNSLKYAGYIDDNGALKQSSANAKAWQSSIRELTAMPAGGATSFLNSTYYANMGSQKVLLGTSAFGEDSGDYTNTIMEGLFPDGALWNDGSALNWNFSVSAQTASSVTIHFVEL
jgi:M6 family metalloprotease-like protein